MKTKEELDALKEESNKVNEKICELTPEELEQVTGGGLATSRDALRIQDEQMGWSGRPAY